MGCIVRLTAIVALATGIHINCLSEASAHSVLGLPEILSGTELLEKNLSNSSQEDGIPGDTEGGSRSLRGLYTVEGEGLPDADKDTGAR